MKVVKRQSNSHYCIICGMENEFGLKAPFYEMEDNSVISIFKYNPLHQSYPERTHGGMISCMLDEIIGRAIWVYEPDTWGVTMDLNVKYRKPVPYDVTLKAVGTIVKNSARAFIGEGKIIDLDGNVLATATATYFKCPLEKIASVTHEDVNVLLPCDRDNIE